MALFMKILVFLARKSDSGNAARQGSFLVGEVIRYLNHYYAESIELEKLAQIANMSKHSLPRHFHSSTGSSPMEYLFRIRLRHAGEMLLNSDCPIDEIVAMGGFYDSNYFCKQFHREFGVSPRAFRQNHLKQHS